MPHVESGQVRALAQTSATRVAQLGDMPTMAEAGFPGCEFDVYNGFVMPAGVPAPVAARIEAAIKAVASDPKVRDRLVAAGFAVVALPGAEFADVALERGGKVEKGGRGQGHIRSIRACVMNLASAVNIADLRTLARRRLPRVIFDFMDGGAEDEITLRANCEGFGRYRFRPRLLTANAKRDLSITLFGQKFSLPFMIAPTGLNGIHWRHADIALASAAAKAGTGFALSTASTDSIEDVGAATSGTKWFQLYPWADRAFCSRMLERARAVGIQDAISHR